jgi:lipopolysaccharide/colanic/teichoic acid biosynthesis glycosyltransferase
MPRASVRDGRHRAFDVTLAAVLVLLLWPVMLGAALLVRISSPGPIIFRHVRVGRNGTRFECFKFRTMNNEAEKLLAELLGACGTMSREWECNQKIRRDPRITGVGQILRRFSIDELPQLFNVLRGDMSIVGPRPIVENEVVRYGDVFELYTTVKPGITGLWQVSGRTNLSYGDRVLLDQFYIRHWSPWLDIYILAKTAVALANRDGAY